MLPDCINPCDLDKTLRASRPLSSPDGPHGHPTGHVRSTKARPTRICRPEATRFLTSPYVVRTPHYSRAGALEFPANTGDRTIVEPRLKSRNATRGFGL